jgi:hypothetical protein
VDACGRPETPHTRRPSSAGVMPIRTAQRLRLVTEMGRVFGAAVVTENHTRTTRCNRLYRVDLAPPLHPPYSDYSGSTKLPSGSRYIAGAAMDELQQPSSAEKGTPQVRVQSLAPLRVSS